MAYYNFNGTLTIDEQAAQRDRQRIQNALPYLESAKSALDRLLEEGQNTKGETGTAILEKTAELKKTVEQLIKNLNETSTYIGKTVVKYQQLDREVKAAIQAQMAQK